MTKHPATGGRLVASDRTERAYENGEVSAAEREALAREVRKPVEKRDA